MVDYVVETYFNGRVDNGFKKFSKVRKNGDGPVVRHIRRITRL